mmetsp:Transcript_3152/g.8308  ORF Transcript_3152/g.8308 Transcript_3152/m.8308 type:complete len:515 (-) Transcript_3152:43-1587(-)
MPSHYWRVVLPQLASRIAHDDQTCRAVVHKALGMLLAEYPHQALWTLAPLRHSHSKARSEAATHIIKRYKASADRYRPGGSAQVDQYVDAVQQLIGFTGHPLSDLIGKNRRFSLQREYPSLWKLRPARVLIPLQASLSAWHGHIASGERAPPPPGAGAGSAAAGGGAADADGLGPPDDDAPTIAGWVDEVQVMQSLAKPKRLGIRSSDGRTYTFLCKPYDDLRKDARMMEFAAVVNVLLAATPDARRRELRLTTYAVQPLTENSGLIEWVPGLMPFRELVNNELSHFAVPSNNEVKAAHEAGGKDKAPWLRKMIESHPPVLHRWFAEAFPEPSEWLGARLRFARTTAISSMVGYLVGLGDRHGENLLVCLRTGTMVHVDFACLFDKGLTLATPERVPFRLTHNVLDGFGVAGADGVFRIAAEVTLATARTYAAALNNVLDAFVHDPLQEWEDARLGSPGEQSERAMVRIRDRIDGMMPGERSAVSVPSQVQQLIRDATSIDNLKDMYIWWCSWL